MPQFNNLESALRYLKKNVKVGIKQVIENKIEGILKQYILDNQYDWTPKDYVRTYQYINCLTLGKVIETSQGFSVELYFDTDKIIPDEAPEGSSWNRHMDIDKNDIKEYLPLWLEEGTKNPIFSHGGNHAIKNTIDYCEENGIHIRELSKILRDNGIDSRFKL